MASSSALTSLRTATYLSNTALALSTFITLNNVYVLARPAAGLEMLGFSESSTTSTDKKSSTSVPQALVQMNAASRIALGLGSVAMWYYGSHRALGWATMAGCVMAVTDGVVSERVGGKAAEAKWVHFGSAPVGLVIGGWLLRIVGI